MQYFKSKTLGHTVIMGRKTFESLANKPLRDRMNIIVSRSHNTMKGHAAGYYVAPSLEKALELANNSINSLKLKQQIFVIGGAELCKTAIQMPQCKRLLFSHVSDTVASKGNDNISDSRTFFDYRMYLGSYSYNSSQSKPHPEFDVHCYDRTKNKDEMQYLRLVRDVLKTGTSVLDRTQTGTLSKFGKMLQFDLRGGKMPLLTTKKMFWRGIVEELLWMLRGSTNALELSQKGVNIWKLNSTRAFLDSRGLSHLQEGDLGPVYGFQWRHFGAKYTCASTNYQGQGTDQIQEIIRLLQDDPYSRRIVLNAWNVTDLNQMALPPCHFACQFSVCPKTKELSCLFSQRSVDIGLGLPFNIAFYALLTHMLARVCHLNTGTLKCSLGDCHIYKNHVAGLTEQLQRVPVSFPILKFVCNGSKVVTDPKDFSFHDLQLNDYTPYPAIPLKMS